MGDPLSRRFLCSGSVMRENKNAEVRSTKYLDCGDRPQVPFLRNAWLTVIGLNQLFWWSRRGLRCTSCGFRQAHPDDTVYSSSQKGCIRVCSPRAILDASSLSACLLGALGPLN